jgi:hypothetical protein
MCIILFSIFIGSNFDLICLFDYFILLKVKAPENYKVDLMLFLLFLI